jgi:hypothetical protein
MVLVSSRLTHHAVKGTNHTWPLWQTAFLFMAGWFILSWPFLSGALTIPWDAKAHFYPQLQFLAHSLHAGENPFWTPFVFAGSPQIADPQSLIVSPPFLLLAWLNPDPSMRAMDSVVMGLLAFAGLSTLLIVRDKGWHPAGALVAAFCFAFGASAAWRIQHIGQIVSFAYWPISLFFLLRALKTPSKAYGFAAGLAAGLMALGRDQVALLGLMLLAGMVIHVSISTKTFRSSLWPLAWGTLGGALVALVPILLTWLFTDISNRPVIDLYGAERGSLHPAHLLTAFIPNLFGADGPIAEFWGPPSILWGPVDLYIARNMGQLYSGALPIFVLLLLGARGKILLHKDIRFFSLALIALLLYALGRYTPFFRLIFESLPGVDLFRRPADATFLIGAMIAFCAGYGVHKLCTSPLRLLNVRRRLFDIASIGAIFAVGLALAFYKNTAHLATFQLIKAGLFTFGAVIVLTFLPRLAARSSLVACCVVAGFMTFDLAVNNGPNESTALPPAEFDVLRTDTQNETIVTLKKLLAEAPPLSRVELVGLGFHWPNASLSHNMHHILGYNPLRLADYAKGTGAGDHVALPDQRVFTPFMPSYRSHLSDILGLRFIASSTDIATIDQNLATTDLALRARTKDAFIYENKRALPRVLFVEAARFMATEALFREGFPHDFDPKKEVILSEQTPPPASTPESNPAQPRIEFYKNTEISITIHAAQEGYVVLNDPYHPWWFANINGRGVPILQANGLFRAVKVPAGSSAITFSFQPFRGAWNEIRQKLIN